MRATSTYDADLVGYGGGADALTRRSPAFFFVGTLLVVIAMLFLLLTIAYVARSQLGDWRALAADPGAPLANPWRLWLNTALLAASGFALHFAQRAQRRGRPGAMRLGIAWAGALAVGFVAGQLVVWNDLVAQGYGVAGNPANSFFYLITGLHGAHVLVGLAVLGVVAGRAWRGLPSSSTALALCGRYWHFLLAVWLAMFALLASPPESLDAFAALCGLR